MFHPQVSTALTKDSSTELLKTPHSKAFMAFKRCHMGASCKTCGQSTRLGNFLAVAGGEVNWWDYSIRSLQVESTSFQGKVYQHELKSSISKLDLQLTISEEFKLSIPLFVGENSCCANQREDHHGTQPITQFTLTWNRLWEESPHTNPPFIPPELLPNVTNNLKVICISSSITPVWKNFWSQSHHLVTIHWFGCSCATTHTSNLGTWGALCRGVWSLKQTRSNKQEAKTDQTTKKGRTTDVADSVFFMFSDC